MKKNNLSTIPGFEIGKNFEESVVRLENDLKSMADGDSIIAGTDEDPIVTDSEKVPIRSFFMDGVYVREMTMYQGTAVIGAIHKHLHMCFLLKGHLSVASSSGVRDYVAPCYIIAEPGEKRVLYAHEDSLWYNTHKNPDNIEDVKLLEKDIVATSYKEYEQYIKNK
jgi:hypothetical protein